MVNSLVKLEKKAEEKEEYIKLLKERLGNQKVPDQQEEDEEDEEEEDGQESMDHDNEGTLYNFLYIETKILLDKVLFDQKIICWNKKTAFLDS